jgi:uncharacterized damage-inducible protein DinB
MRKSAESHDRPTRLCGRVAALSGLFIEGRIVLAAPDLRDTILAAWRTNNRVTVFLVERLPAALWGASVPGAPRRTVRMIAGHIHNARCMWIKMVGKEHGIPVPAGVDRRRVSRKELVSALKRSSRGIDGLLRLACESGGSIPTPSTYAWRNLPLDVGHVLTYFVAHEGHHRGQIVMLARQLGHRLPVSVTGGLWQWTKRAREAGR